MEKIKEIVLKNVVRSNNRNELKNFFLQRGYSENELFEKIKLNIGKDGEFCLEYWIETIHGTKQSFCTYWMSQNPYEYYDRDMNELYSGTIPGIVGLIL